MAWNKWAIQKARIKDFEAEIHTLTDECHRMYKLMQEISDAGDVHRPEMNGYFKSVNLKVEKGLNGGLFYSDGELILRKKSNG
ncbi:MAG: hypothetical protein K0U78_15040 [Actinomycetia bacterium]|nr:hypothetical protein [Actinomycetes bacterium]